MVTKPYTFLFFGCVEVRSILQSPPRVEKIDKIDVEVRLDTAVQSATQRSREHVQHLQDQQLPDEVLRLFADTDSQYAISPGSTYRHLALALDMHGNTETGVGFDIVSSCDQGMAMSRIASFITQAPMLVAKRAWNGIAQSFRQAEDYKLQDLSNSIGNVNILESKKHFCSDNSSYWFAVVPAAARDASGDVILDEHGHAEVEVDKIAVEFMGSGTCFNDETCRLCPKGIEDRLKAAWEQLSVNLFMDFSWILFGNSTLPNIEDMVQDAARWHVGNFKDLLSQSECFDVLPWAFRAIAWWSDHNPPSFLFNRMWVAPYDESDMIGLGDQIRPHPLKDYTYIMVQHCTSDAHLGKGTQMLKKNLKNISGT